MLVAVQNIQDGGARFDLRLDAVFGYSETSLANTASSKSLDTKIETREGGTQSSSITANYVLIILLGTSSWPRLVFHIDRGVADSFETS